MRTQQTLRYKNIRQTSRVEFTLTKLQKNIETIEQTQITLAHKYPHTNKGSQGKKYFQFTNKSGQVTQNTKAFPKDIQIKEILGSWLYGTSKTLDISTFSLKDERVLSSISYSLKAAQASSKYKSYATSPQ